jgi:hypothetical protein
MKEVPAPLFSRNADALTADSVMFAIENPMTVVLVDAVNTAVFETPILLLAYDLNEDAIF